MPFKKGNKGRPVGTKNAKTKEWEAQFELSKESSEAIPINYKRAKKQLGLITLIEKKINVVNT